MLIEPIDPKRAVEAIALLDDVGLTRPWNDARADLDRALRSPAASVLAGTQDGRLIATAMVGHDGHRGWVYYLAVRLDARRAGVGREMMRACEAWLRERGVPKLNLMVRGDNQATADFYRAIGYAQDDVQLLEAEDVARYIGMTADRVYREVRAGRMPHIRLGRYVRFRRESVDAWLASRERGPAPVRIRSR